MLFPLPVRYDGLFDFPTTVNDMIVSIFGLAKHLEIDLFGTSNKNEI